MIKFILITLALIQVCMCQEVSAVLEPKLRKLISTQRDGVLLKCPVAGSRVSRGQVILSQPKVLLEAEAEQININIHSLKDEESYYLNMLKKKKDQLKEGFINDEEYEAVSHQLTKVTNKMKSYQIELKKIRFQIEESSIKADMNGLVSKELKRQGEFSKSGEVCIEIIDDTVLYAVFPFEAREISTLQNKAISVSVDGKKYTGKIEFISPEVDAASGLLQVKVAIDNRDLNIRSGQRAIVYFSESKTP